MFNDLDTLKNNAGDVNTRQQFIGSAQNFATFFNSVASGLGQVCCSRIVYISVGSNLFDHSCIIALKAVCLCVIRMKN